MMLSKPLNSEPPARSLEALLALYFAARSLRPATRERYGLACRNLAAFLGTDPEATLLDPLSIETLASFKQHIVDRTSSVTWNTERRHLNALLRFAVRLGWLPSNPLALVSAARVAQRPVKALDRASIGAYIDLLTHASKRNAAGSLVDQLPPQWFWLALVTTLFHTGMRIGQLVGLNWGDVSFSDRSILLRAETSKTHREWTVPLSQELLGHFDRLRSETIAMRRRPPLPEEQVFCLPLFSEWKANFVGGRMVRDNVDAFFQRLHAVAPKGLPRLSAHRVRHTTATILANSVPNLKVVQQLLGHSNISTTYGYVHVDLADMRRAQELL